MGVGRNYVLDLPFVVTEAITKYQAVKLGTAVQTIDAADTLGELAIGIAMETASADDATAGRVIAVAVMGTAIWEAGAAVSIGDRLRTAADGQAVALAATTAEQNQVGIALTAAANAGELFTVLLTPATTFTTT
jgi:hypothetical protein